MRKQHLTVRAHLLPLLLLLLLLLHPLTSADLEEEEKVPLEVIVESSRCSATCGLGIKTQTLCLLKDGKTAVEEEDDVRSKAGSEVSDECRVRKVKCLESWRCGLSTRTVTAGQRVDMDCLGDVMEAMGRFSWRVSWRHARGIISSDDSLFARFAAPLLGRVVLDPVSEEDAGTYRCLVQDASFRRVKRVYWGIRVLPVGVLNLDYESSLALWDATGNQHNQSGSDQRDQAAALPVTLLLCLALAAATSGLMLLGLYCTVRRREHPRPAKGRRCL